MMGNLSIRLLEKQSRIELERAVFSGFVATSLVQFLFNCNNDGDTNVEYDCLIIDFSRIKALKCAMT